MEKRIALVTGGMGGIGTEICRSLYNEGYQVIAAYRRSHEDALIWQNSQKENGYEFDIVYVDVTDFDSCDQTVKQILNDIGPIDILVNNAGITRDRTFSKMAQTDWDIVIETNLSSVCYVTHAVIDSMKQRKYGRIINISSINGQKGQFGQVNYSAAKAGMHGFTKALALEVANKGITVNTISPGYVETDMINGLSDDVRNQILEEIPMRRFAKPEEIANIVTFLADEKNSYITGANISVNGGQYMA